MTDGDLNGSSNTIIYNIDKDGPAGRARRQCSAQALVDRMTSLASGNWRLTLNAFLKGNGDPITVAEGISHKI